MKRRSMAALAAALGLAALGTAQASEREPDAALLSQAKVGLSQAVAAAERGANGKAVRASLEGGKGTPHYEVEVLSAGRNVDVKVDARDGKVLGVKEDPRD